MTTTDGWQLHRQAIHRHRHVGHPDLTDNKTDLGKLKEARVDRQELIMALDHRTEQFNATGDPSTVLDDQALADAHQLTELDDGDLEIVYTLGRSRYRAERSRHRRTRRWSACSDRDDRVRCTRMRA